jgi:riboflavin biosynthesis pyrimidine reductase
MLAELYRGPEDGPRVRAMMNTSIDGAIAGADGISASLRNPDDSFVFSVLRGLADVILVGAGTVRVEDYRRVPEHAGLAVVTRSGVMPASIGDNPRSLLLTPADAVARAVTASGLPADRVLAAGSPRDWVDRLVQRGFHTIQVEGGAQVLGALAASGVLTELCVSVTHRTVGGPSPRILAGAAHDQDWELLALVVGEHATVTRYRRRDT